MTARISPLSSVPLAPSGSLHRDQARQARWTRLFLEAAHHKKLILKDEKTPFSGHFSKKGFVR